MEDLNEKDEYLNKERNIIKDLILSKINKDGYEEIYKIYLRQTEEINNSFIKEFFDTREPVEEDGFYNPASYDAYPVSDSDNKDLYEKFDEYLGIFRAKEKLDKNYTIDDDLDYRQSLICFVANYNISKRLYEITKWYFDNDEDTDHDKEFLTRLITMDSERLFALRNILADKELGLDFDREDLDIPDVRDFMVSFFKLRLAHDYFLSNIILINEMNTDSNKALSTAMLFHTLNTSAFLSVAKEYGCTIEQLDLENVVNSARIAVNSFSDDSEVVKSEDYLNATIEVEGIISTANNIADSFNNQKVKKLN